MNPPHIIEHLVMEWKNTRRVIKKALKPFCWVIQYLKINMQVHLQRKLMVIIFNLDCLD